MGDWIVSVMVKRYCYTRQSYTKLMVKNLSLFKIYVSFIEVFFFDVHRKDLKVCVWQIELY